MGLEGIKGGKGGGLLLLLALVFGGDDVFVFCFFCFYGFSLANFKGTLHFGCCESGAWGVGQYSTVVGFFFLAWFRGAEIKFFFLFSFKEGGGGFGDTVQ